MTRNLSLCLLLLAIFQAKNTVSQTSVKNANTDNIILIPGKKFLFKEEISASARDSVFYFTLSADKKPLFNQTLIRYTYYFNIDSAVNGNSHFWEETLATENKKWYAIHPPRGLVNEVHQLLPFPEIPLRKKNGYLWKEKLAGMKGWDNFPENTIVKSRYHISSDTTIIVFEKTLLCKKVIAESVSKAGTGKSVFYFHPEFGFVLIENKINDTLIKISLVDVWQ